MGCLASNNLKIVRWLPVSGTIVSGTISPGRSNMTAMSNINCYYCRTLILSLIVDLFVICDYRLDSSSLIVTLLMKGVCFGAGGLSPFGLFLWMLCLGWAAVVSGVGANSPTNHHNWVHWAELHFRRGIHLEFLRSSRLPLRSEFTSDRWLPSRFPRKKVLRYYKYRSCQNYNICAV